MNSNPFPSAIFTDGSQTIVGTCSEQAMVDVYSGNFLEKYTVADIPTVGLPLRFFLCYNSQEGIDSTLGNKWRHNLMISLSFTTAGVYPVYATYYSESGTQYVFTQASAGAAWVLNQGRIPVLMQNFQVRQVRTEKKKRPPLLQTQSL